MNYIEKYFPFRTAKSQSRKKHPTARRNQKSSYRLACLRFENLEDRKLLAVDLAISVDDGSAYSFPGVKTLYDVDIVNNGTSTATAANIVHAPTSQFDDVKWSRTVVPSGVPFAAQFDISALNGSNGFTVGGFDPSDNSGASVSRAGDVNNDGIDDFVIGANLANVLGTDEGQTYVVFGTNLGFPADLDARSLNGANGFLINGIDGNDRAGQSVSQAGDFNDDGIDDLVIGAIWATGGGATQRGRTFVVYGGTGIGATGTLELGSLDGTNGFAINGIDLFDRSGETVRGIGDINNDNVDDIMIGASEADPNGNRSGEVYILLGGSTVGQSGSFNLATLDGTNGFTISGLADAHRLGFTTSGAGDVNDDGVPDIILGVEVASPGGNDKVGRTYVVYGTTNIGNSGTLNLASLDGTNGFTIDGGELLGQAGSSVSSLGDVNADGVDDIIIGARTSTPDELREKAGKAYVIFGNANLAPSGNLSLSSIDGTNGFVIHGELSNDQLGESVAGVGDITGDGVADFVVGTARADQFGKAEVGKSYVIFGGIGLGATGVLETSQLDGLNGFAVNGTAASDNFGRSINAAGDINDDGYQDIILGASKAKFGTRSGAGETYVLYGRNAPVRTIYSGVGDINHTLNIEAGTTIHYSMEGVVKTSATGTLVTTASVVVGADPAGEASDTNTVSTAIPTIDFSEASYQINEDGTLAGNSILLVRTGELDVKSQISVSFAGSQENGVVPASLDDFLSGTVALTFFPGETSKMIEIPVFQDDIDEPAEAIDAQVTPINQAATGVQPSSMITIVDDDNAGVTIRAVQSEGGPAIADPLSIGENDGPLIYEVVLQSQPTSAVDFEFSLQYNAPIQNLFISDPGISSYHIGNSLTRDAKTELFPHIVGKHLDWGKSLDHIATHPLDADLVIEPYGTYIEALENYDWDYVGVQPFGGPTSTLATDVAFIQEVIALEPNATIVLYEAWPSKGGSTYQDAWATPLPSGSSHTNNTLAYHTALRNELDLLNIEYIVAPAGYILESIDIDAANVPGINSAHDFYGDELHLNEDGSVLAYSTLYYTMYGELPTTIPFSHGLSAGTISAINAHILSLAQHQPESNQLATLTFNAQNWNVPRYIYANPAQLALGDITYDLIAAVQSDDAIYDSILNAPEVSSVTVVSVEKAGFTVTETDGNTSMLESATDSVSLVLDAKPLEDVVINISSANPAIASVMPVSLTFTPNDWDTPRILTITGATAGTTSLIVEVDDTHSDDFFDPLENATVAVTVTTTADTTPPTITGLKIAPLDGEWTTAFLNHIDPAGIGYPIPHGADQSKALPWDTLQRIFVEFSEDVGDVLTTDIEFTSLDNFDYSGFTVTYDDVNYRATIELVQPISIDTISLAIKATITDLSNNALDGDWQNGVTLANSGNSTAGGDFEFEFHVLPGDVNGSGAVAVSDLGAIRVALGQNTTGPNYQIRADLNGSGVLAVNDLALLRDNLGRKLPVGQPLSRTTVAAIRLATEDVDAFMAAAADVKDNAPFENHLRRFLPAVAVRDHEEVWKSNNWGLAFIS